VGGGRGKEEKKKSEPLSIRGRGKEEKKGKKERKGKKKEGEEDAPKSTFSSSLPTLLYCKGEGHNASRMKGGREGRERSRHFSHRCRTTISFPTERKEGKKEGAGRWAQTKFLFFSYNIDSFRKKAGKGREKEEKKKRRGGGGEERKRC